MEPKRTYIVTGGNTGLGYQCSRFLGANPENLVVIACRDKSRGEQAAENLRRIGCPVKVLPLDLASLASVRHFVEEFRRATLPPLAGIVCNAGVQNIAAPTKTTDDVVEQHVQADLEPILHEDEQLSATGHKPRYSHRTWAVQDSGCCICVYFRPLPQETCAYCSCFS